MTLLLYWQVRRKDYMEGVTMYRLRALLYCVSLLMGLIQINAQTTEQTIWDAAGSGDIKALRAEIKKGTDVNGELPGAGVTPLVTAVASNQPKAVRMLLKAGADPNKQSQDGGTALHAAAFVGSDKTAAELINGGADIFAQNFNGQMASDLMELGWPTTQYVADMLSLELNEDEVKSGREAIGKLFEKETAKRAKTDPWVALYSGNEKAMKRHVRKMEDLNVQQSDFGITPLSIAALFGYTSIVEILLDGGADPNATNRNLATALHATAVMGNADIVQLLLNRGATRDLRDEGGGTAKDATSLDWMATEALAGALSVPFEFDKVTNRKKVVIELLSSSE